MDETKKTKKKKMNKTMITLLAVIIVLIFAIIGLLVYRHFWGPIKLVGDKEVTINLGEKFKDPGTDPSNSTVKSNLDVNKVGDYKIEYTHGKYKLTRIVHVVDSSQLVLGLRGTQHTLVREGDPYIEGGAFSFLKGSGPVSDVKTSGKVDTSKPGTYKVKYTAKAGGITKTITRDVEVVAKDKFKADADGVPVLMYHWVYVDSDIPDDLNDNYIHANLLEQHLKYLTENGYYYPSWKELKAYIDGKIALPEKSVILTFDDGAYRFLMNGIPLLEKYKVPATSYIIGEQEGAYKVSTYANPYVDFQSHTYGLHNAGSVPGHRGLIANKSKSEIVNDFKQIIGIVGSNESFAYPYGDVTEDGKAAAAEVGYLCSFSTNYGFVKPGDDFRALDRIRTRGSNSLETWISTLS